MKVEWLRTVHVQFLFKSELLCYAKNVDSASFVSFRNNINVKLNLKMRVMRNKKKTLIISLVLLACFASSACAVSKGMKKVDGLDMKNTSLVITDGISKLETEVINNTGSDYELKEFTIIMKDSEDKIIIELTTASYRGSKGSVVGSE